MKIIRNGIEIELTDEELRNAYYEQQFLFDREDCRYTLVEILTENQMNALIGDKVDEILDLAADKLRRNIDKYEMDFSYARDEAVRDTLNELNIEIEGDEET
ncbi:MAG TPA: hypothetical protein DCW90_09395 [Lachnospiraceae bacterium]|nr:hypothetical protein [Lachnospiraceae bacterium]